MGAKLGSTHAKSTTLGKRILVAMTCRRCGEFKMASEYRKKKTGYYFGYCNHCMYLSAKQSDARRNAISLDTAKRRREPWTWPRIKELEELVDLNLSDKDVALKLGRSISAITAAKHRFIPFAEKTTP